MNAADIQEAILRDRWHRHFAIGNYTPAKWWECDVFELTGSDYFIEYEIKISRGDFFADAKKVQEVRLSWDERAEIHMKRAAAKAAGQTPPEYPTERKHDLLAAGDPRGPSRFWYATPAGLIKPEEVPTWAGLLEIERRPDCAVAFTRQVKPAPRLHKEKCRQAVRDHARGVCYYRMHGLRHDVRNLGLQLAQWRARHGPWPDLAKPLPVQTDTPSE